MSMAINDLLLKVGMQKPLIDPFLKLSGTTGKLRARILGEATTTEIDSILDKLSAPGITIKMFDRMAVRTIFNDAKSEPPITGYVT